MEMIMGLFESFYKNKRVFITGVTGFKGSWLALWLNKLGADVAGYADCIPTEPSLFKAAALDKFVNITWGDIRDFEKLSASVESYKPDVVFHLAAQSLVKKSYEQPRETFEVNAIGTINVLEVLRKTSYVKAAVFITSDKCYQNVEWDWGYRENDKLGGNDPYSASKAAAEIVIHSYLKSYFQNSVPLASVRAGNVIGGGDWALDRIVPDCVKAWSENKEAVIRNPSATRPWQHVLEPLSGYMLLAVKLAECPEKFRGESFNFGPLSEQNRTVLELISEMSKAWKNTGWKILGEDNKKVHEAKLLKLCCDKALAYMDWRPTLEFSETSSMTAEWYSEFYSSKNIDMKNFTSKQIDEYINKAKVKKQIWGL
jgi:CDP-glucose 4,6-dehydratase